MLDLTSASQIETFEACARKGALKYVGHVPAPQNASAALGTEIDDTQLQPFLRDGRALDFSRPSGEIAQTIVQWLPPAGSCAEGGVGEVQHYFTMPSPTWHGDAHCGLGFQGFTDLWMPNGGLLLPDTVEPTVDGFVPPVVCDFKSTKNFKWAKTADDLRTDVQAQSYAFWAMYETRKPVVDLVWLYMRTEGARQGKRVHLRVHAADVAKQFVSIDERARKIHALKISVTDPMSVPPNPEHCDAYGGCPYREKCNLGPGEIADAAAAKAARARKKKEETIQMTATATPTATTGLLARLKAQRAEATPAAVTAAPPTTVSAPEPPPTPAPAPTTPTAVAAPIVGINPPEQSLPPAPPVGSAEAAPKRGPGRPPKNAAAPAAADTGGERVKAVWGKEKISPIAYNDFEVGPFEAEGFVRPGETLTQAHERIYAELTVFAEKAREQKAISYAAVRGKVAA